MSPNFDGIFCFLKKIYVYVEYNIPHIFSGASNSKSIGCDRNISRDFKHSPRISASVNWTFLPGLDPRTRSKWIEIKFYIDSSLRWNKCNQICVKYRTERPLVLYYIIITKSSPINMTIRTAEWLKDKPRTHRGIIFRSVMCQCLIYNRSFHLPLILKLIAMTYKDR